jgi:uncharacterized glyoxalase superfamily protein PhnB
VLAAAKKFESFGGFLMKFQTIPIIRIFDEEKAKEFYLDFLGMVLDWEHRFEPGYPIYMQVSLGEFVLHLSEHSGDCTPGSKVFVNVSALDPLFEQIAARPYKYNKPKIELAPWGDRGFTVTDPFSNRILFNESTEL